MIGLIGKLCDKYWECMMFRGKLLSGIKIRYVDNWTCVRVRGGESERFRIVGRDRGVAYPLGCSMYIWMD